MREAVKPGGRVAIWVYGRENNGWLLWALDPMRRLLFSRLPIGAVHALSYSRRRCSGCCCAWGCRRIEYFRLLDSSRLRYLRSIVFDQILPRIAHYWRKEEVQALIGAPGWSMSSCAGSTRCRGPRSGSGRYEL